MQTPGTAGPATETRRRQSRPTRLLIGAVALAVVSVLAFWTLNVVLATAILILGLTVLALAFAARDWENHPSYEDREKVRARKRAAKRERTKAARDRDRARWQAHQARKAARSARSGD